MTLEFNFLNFLIFLLQMGVSLFIYYVITQIAGINPFNKTSMVILSIVMLLTTFDHLTKKNSPRVRLTDQVQPSTIINGGIKSHRKHTMSDEERLKYNRTLIKENKE